MTIWPAERRPAGFTSLMYDASALPYRTNVARTRAAAGRAHEQGLWVEGELGYIGGKNGLGQNAHSPDVRTSPDEAAEFVTSTEIDGGRWSR